MQYNTFFSYTYNCQVKQLNKRQAATAFENGEEVLLKASNMRFDNPWSSPCPVQKNRGWNDNFDILVADFKYYNCDSERGPYVQFFIKIK